MDTRGRRNWGYPGNAKIKRKKRKRRGDKLKYKSKQNNIQNKPERQGSPKTGPDSAAGIDFECCWSHSHAVCHLLAWETHEATETLRERNVAGEI